MADTTKHVLSVVATTSKKISDLPIKNGQLIFVHDRQKVVLDYDGKRKFYNSIIVLETESERQETTPANGLFYFVVGTSVLWFYQDGWVQITTPPQEIIFIGIQLPELGKENILYVDKINKEISIWDVDTQKFMVVADKAEEITSADIDALFS